MSKLEGVSKVEVSLQDKRAVVTHEPAKATTEKIEATIEDLGFECELQDSGEGSQGSHGVPFPKPVAPAP